MVGDTGIVVWVVVPSLNFGRIGHKQFIVIAMAFAESISHRALLLEIDKWDFGDIVGWFAEKVEVEVEIIIDDDGSIILLGHLRFGLIRSAIEAIGLWLHSDMCLLLFMMLIGIVGSPVEQLGFTCFVFWHRMDELALLSTILLMDAFWLVWHLVILSWLISSVYK